MNRTLQVIGCVGILMIGYALAQFSPPQLSWSGPAATSTSQCKTPGPTDPSICPVTTSGVISYFYWNGTSWTQSAGTSGATWTKGSCNTWSGGNTSLIFSSCAVQ